MNENLIAFLRVLDPEDNQTGGGAASAISSAMAAALVGMVARLSIGRKGMEPQAYYQEIDTEAQELAAALFLGAGADSEAFDEVMAAYRMPKDTLEAQSGRTAAIQKAIIHATRVPLNNATRSARTLELCEKLYQRSNPNAASDLDCARYLAEAGLKGSLSNVEINLDSIKDPGTLATLREKHDLLRKKFAQEKP
jgi:formiminotetrahydrofolate cyclodeaminase